MRCARLNLVLGSSSSLHINASLRLQMQTAVERGEISHVVVVSEYVKSTLLVARKQSESKMKGEKSIAGRSKTEPAYLLTLHSPPPPPPFFSPSRRLG